MGIVLVSSRYYCNFEVKHKSNCKPAYTYSKKLITVWTTSLARTVITYYFVFRKKKRQTKIKIKMKMVLCYLRTIVQNGSKTLKNVPNWARLNTVFSFVSTILISRHPCKISKEYFKFLKALTNIPKKG